MTIQHASVLASRIALFVIYVWFGALKVIGQSPATPMVTELLHRTIPFIPDASFLVLFGLFEMLVGILFMVPGWEKPALGLFVLHMISCVLPLFVMTAFVWIHPFVPTLEGQYIIKNLALIACALTIASSIRSGNKNTIDTISPTRDLSL